MTISQSEIQVVIEPTYEVDAEELQDLTRQLYSELLDTDADDVEFVMGGEIPAGAKGSFLAVDWGSLLVSLTDDGGALGGIFNTINSWRNRHHDTKLTLTHANGTKLEIEGALNQENLQLIMAAFQQTNTVNQGGVNIHVAAEGTLTINGDIVGRDQNETTNTIHTNSSDDTPSDS